MNISTENLLPIVVIACLILGYVIKNTTILANQLNGFIPLILSIFGAILGCISNQSISLESLVYGALSGLASTGLHQTFKNFIGGETNDNERD